MKKTKLVTGIALIAVAGVLSAFDIQDNNGKAGRTGSPNESTCNVSCHTGFPLNDGTGSITITSPDLINWEYMPGDTYNISVTVARTGNSLFGVDVECLTGASPAQNAGTLLITNTTETQIKVITVNTVLRRNVVHKLNGGVGTDSKTFSFKWIAPATNVGTVTFYASGNAANGNNQDTGDHIYTTSQAVAISPSAGVAEHPSAATFSLYPNPAHDQVNVNFTAASGDAVNVTLYSLNGQEVTSLFNGTGDGIEHNVQLSLPSDLAPGVYLVRVTEGTTAATQRVIVN